MVDVCLIPHAVSQIWLQPHRPAYEDTLFPGLVGSEDRILWMSTGRVDDARQSLARHNVDVVNEEGTIHGVTSLSWAICHFICCAEFDVLLDVSIKCETF